MGPLDSPSSSPCRVKGCMHELNLSFNLSNLRKLRSFNGETSNQ
ncbi:hypothetical protein NE237_017522 [Protea cynaroides]|uniref:Uncharacterized protein n=1 Tax=Protea cynaroides TaxID=273540 RepID=A0A9Q0K873_9MAGN|nr:hypothetical protein NE237_017522 [Protea cynaroides]